MASILRNTSALFIAHLIGRALAFGLLILLPRYFSDTDVGVYVWAVALTNIMSVVIVFGMHVPLIRDIAVDRSKTQVYISSALILRVLFSLLAMGTLVGGLHLFHLPERTIWLTTLLGAAEVLNVLAQLFRCTFRAYEEMQYEGVVVVLERLFVFLIGGGGVILGFDLLAFGGIVLCGAALNLTLSLGIMLRRFTRLTFRLQPQLWRQLIVQSFPFALGGIFNIIYFRIDTVLLPALCRTVDGRIAVAWYGLAYSLVTALTILPGAFTNAMFPVMSRAYAKDRSGLSQLYTDALRWMLNLALPMALGLTLLAGQIVDLLWGLASYPPGTVDAALRLLSWSGGLIFLNSVIGIVLRAADRRMAFASLIGGAMVFNLLLNLMLVPRLNHEGAALAMLFTEAVMFSVGFGYVSKSLAKPRSGYFVLKPLLCASVMGGLIWLLRDRMPVYGLVPMAGLIYFAMMRWWGEFRLTELVIDRQDSP